MTADPTPPPAEPPQNPPNSTTEEAEADAVGTPSRGGPVGMVSWGTGTLVGVFTGLLYGGAKEANANVSKDAEVMLKMGSTTDKREQYRLMRDAMEKRLSSSQLMSIPSVPGSPMWRARNVLVGSALGAGICFPLGWVQLKLAEKANLEIETSKSPSDLAREQGNQSRVGAAIDRLKGSLRK
ncbi:hypothetical protein ACQ4PT_021361 [Festuca glaucescens]